MFEVIILCICLLNDNMFSAYILDSAYCTWILLDGVNKIY